MEQSSLFANSISINTNLLSQNNYQESVRFTTVTLCAISTSIILRLPPSHPFLFVPSHLGDIALPPSPPWHCVPYSIRALVYHSIFWKPPSPYQRSAHMVRRLSTICAENLWHHKNRKNLNRCVVNGATYREKKLKVKHS